jgi:UDP-glucuronate decarboxylase
VVSNVICQALSGAPVTIYGDGSQTRSFCYVDDLVEGILRLTAYDGPQPGPVNLGNPDELTVSDLVERVMRMTGSNSPVTQRPLPQDDPRRRKPDISRAKALLGWEPIVSLEEGLQATIPYFASELRQADSALHFGRHPQAPAALAAAE